MFEQTKSSVKGTQLLEDAGDGRSQLRIRTQGDEPAEDSGFNVRNAQRPILKRLRIVLSRKRILPGRLEVFQLGGCRYQQVANQPFVGVQQSCESLKI